MLTKLKGQRKAKGVPWHWTLPHREPCRIRRGENKQRCATLVKVLQHKHHTMRVKERVRKRRRHGDNKEMFRSMDAKKTALEADSCRRRHMKRLVIYIYIYIHINTHASTHIYKYDII